MDIYILIGFGIVLVFVLLEAFLSKSWNHVYFQTGIPLYKKRILYPDNQNLNLNDKFLSNKFKRKKSSLHPFIKPPSLVFQEINSENIAFREKLFESTSFNFPPLLRGIIRLKHMDKNVQVIGFLNWYIICFYILYLFIVFRIWDFSNLSSVDLLMFILIYPLPIFCFCFFFQMIIFNNIINYLKSITKIPSTDYTKRKYTYREFIVFILLLISLLIVFILSLKHCPLANL